MRIATTLMRGGTSKALFFHEQDLPEAGPLRDEFILAAYGSPDPYQRQIDGVGGATSSTSKVVIIGDGSAHDVDVTYEFGQVGIGQDLIDRRGNCGNLSSAVGPFAVDEGLVTPTDPVTIVRFLNTNTNKVIVAHVPTRDGRFDPVGDFELPGVPGTGSRLQLEYLDPSGAVTGSLLPSGHVVDSLDVPGVGTISVSLVDAANPLVFVRWEDIGLTGLEHLRDLDADTELRARVESIRAHASVLAGIADSVEDATKRFPSVPKLSIVGTPRDYVTTDGEQIAADQTSVRASMMSMGRPHPSYPLTGAIATAVAARIPGTLVHNAAETRDDQITIGHPSGLLPLSVDIEQDGHEWKVNSVSAYRTSRRLMEGHVLVPDERLDELDPAHGDSAMATTK
jgi:2-methylaconitate cis-trans-isomerase PrpF